jgi:hypothetical protein
MTRIFSVFALSAALFACLVTSSAQAQVTRTFVSGTGTANSSCSYTEPCRFFTQAIAALPSGGGEIDVLDPGSYGQITISSPVSIIGRGWTTITATNSTAAITITNTTGSVSISGVQLDGGGTGQYGINFTGNGTLHVLDTVIRNFAGSGVQIATTGHGAQSNVTMRNVALLDNTGSGLIFSPTASDVALFSGDNITANGNGNGVYINATGGVYAVFDRLIATQNNNGFRADTPLVGGAYFGFNVTFNHSVLMENNGNGGDIYDNAVSGIGTIVLSDHNRIDTMEWTSGNEIITDGSNLIEEQIGGGTFTTQTTH